jgi:hypothetical protein
MTEVEKVVEYGDISYYIKGTKILHREDGPAVILPGAAKIWYCNGKKHREDGPAVIYSDGSESWYYNGKLHREDGPAIVHSTGMVSWVLDNELFDTKEEWLKALPEGKKLKALYSEYFIKG